MIILFGLNKIRKFKHPVVALGIFDGVHLAHRKIIQAAVNKTREIEGTSILVTFHPHPQGEKSLYSLEHRLNLIAGLGIDVSMVINFDRKLSQISAENFVKNILVKKAGAQYIFVGKNFRFGRYAAGDFRLLEQLSVKYGFQLKGFEIIKTANRAVSSTYIRQLIQKGRLREAQNLLLRPVSVLGTVIHGTSLATKLGFPTANVDPHHEILPPAGVYAVQVIWQNNKLNGICYIGRKPTFVEKKLGGKGQKDTHIEVHIFNFEKNIYGHNLEIRFLKKIRAAKKFTSLSALTVQVRKDIKKVNALFARHSG